MSFDSGGTMGRCYQEVVSIASLLVVTMDWLGVCLIKIVEADFLEVILGKKCHHKKYLRDLQLSFPANYSLLCWVSWKFLSLPFDDLEGSGVISKIGDFSVDALL